MSLLFSGPKGNVEERWVVYAALRDNVQHHLEGGMPSEAFGVLHRVTEALGGGQTDLSATNLRACALRVKDELCALPIEQMAISARTRAVISMTWPLPDKRETCLVADWGGTIPFLRGDESTLGDVFGDLVDALIRITEEAGGGDVVEVRDL